MHAACCRLRPYPPVLVVHAVQHPQPVNTGMHGGMHGGGRVCFTLPEVWGGQVFTAAAPAAAVAGMRPRPQQVPTCTSVAVAMHGSRRQWWLRA